jgi:hypothetical protein
MDEPRMVAIRIHLRSEGAHGVVGVASLPLVHGGSKCDRGIDALATTGGMPVEAARED